MLYNLLPSASIFVPKIAKIMESVKDLLSPENLPTSSTKKLWQDCLQNLKRGEFRRVEYICTMVLNQKPHHDKFAKLREISRERICRPVSKQQLSSVTALVCLNVKANQPLCLNFDQKPNFEICIFDYTGENYLPTIPHGISHYFSLKTEGKGQIIQFLADKLPLHYSFYGFLDDDILISVSDINRMLFIGNLFQLDLFQASLSLESYINLAHLVHKEGYKIKESSLIEIMMPFLSNYAYQNSQKLFPESISGWGLDYLISAKLFAEKRKIAVIHDVIASHLKPTSSRNWTCSNGKTSLEELHYLIKKYKLTNYPIF